MQGHAAFHQQQVKRIHSHVCQAKGAKEAQAGKSSVFFWYTNISTTSECVCVCVCDNDASRDLWLPRALSSALMLPSFAQFI